MDPQNYAPVGPNQCRISCLEDCVRCPPDGDVPTAECLLRRVKEVRRVLHRRGFSEHAIDQAVTVLCRAAMPYIKGIKTCHIKNRRAWAFKVASRAAKRAAERELRVNAVEPAILAAMVTDSGLDEELFDISGALRQLTDQQYVAVDLYYLKGMSLRTAAKEMGIAVGTFCAHLDAAKARLEEILLPLIPTSWLGVWTRAHLPLIWCEQTTQSEF